MQTAEEAVGFSTSTGPVRVITAASLFDGHDAAINVDVASFIALWCVNFSNEI